MTNEPDLFPDPEWDIVIRYKFKNTECQFRHLSSGGGKYEKRLKGHWACYNPETPDGTECREINCPKEIDFED